MATLDRPEAWLTRVALNTGNSWIRRRTAERRAYRRHGVAPDHLDVDSADVVVVRQAVAMLPARQRAAVIYLRRTEHR
jgi:DNA-directed RNA polymerase specialized sigma24 family protein